MLSKLIRFIEKRLLPLPTLVKNVAVTTVILILAYLVSSVLHQHSGAENNSALVFTLAITCIARFTTGYVPGIVASFLSAVAINYYFMYPYSQFSMSFAGYPVAFVSFLVIACIVSALTTRVKIQAAEAMQREQRTKTLYEQNQRLTEEKNRIELEAARENIRSNILRAVSHDLRTPLTAISGAASVLLENMEDKSPQSVYLIQDIKENADGLSAMVENLLSITRIQQGDMHLNKTPEMLEEVAADALMNIRKRFPDIHISLELPDALLILPMEPMLIKQVIINLLENAIRHSGDREHIRLTISRDGSFAVVSVSDQGTGLPPETLRFIREGRPMPMDRSGDSTRGMGIGLSVCQSIIKAHGGYFTADNQPEGGARFQFGLPLDEEHETEEDTYGG